MPKVRRSRLPPALLKHLALRVDQRQIRIEQIEELLRWLDTDPTVPQGKWFRRFEDFTTCGEGELVKTFLLPGQAPVGEEVV
jgi:hypothetical protein